MNFLGMLGAQLLGVGAEPAAPAAPPAPVAEVQLSRDVVEALLTLDWRERVAMKWPLVGAAELTRLRAACLRRPTTPGLYSARPWNSNSSRAPVTDEDVAASLTKRFPLLGAIFAIEGAAEHLLVAGGAVTSAVSSARAYHGTDCDLFVYGYNTTDEATALTARIMEVIETHVEESSLSLDFRRTGHMVSASVFTDELYRGSDDGTIYQVVLRLYRSPGQVLGGFDIPACAVGWSPVLGVVATQMGAFSIASEAIIIDTTRRSPSYEARLLKYARRGFVLVAPSLSGELPQDGFYLGRLRCTTGGQPSEFQLSPSAWSEGALDDAHDYGCDVQHPVVNVYRNLNVASRDDASGGLLLLSGETFAELISEPTVIGLDSVERLYMARARHPLTWSHRPLLNVLRSWYGPDALEVVKAKMSRDQSAMEAITRRTIERVTRNMRAAAAHAQQGLQWITANPGSQRHLFSGSFHPIFESPAAFYPRSNYTPSRVGLSSDVRVVLCQLRRQHSGWASLNRDLLSLLVWGYVIPTIAHNVIDAYVALCAANPLPEKPKFGF